MGRRCHPHRYTQSMARPPCRASRYVAIKLLTPHLFIDSSLSSMCLCAADYDKVSGQHGRLFLWTTWYWYTPVQAWLRSSVRKRLQDAAGPFQRIEVVAAPTVVAPVATAQA